MARGSSAQYEATPGWMGPSRQIPWQWSVNRQLPSSAVSDTLLLVRGSAWTLETSGHEGAERRHVPLPRRSRRFAD